MKYLELYRSDFKDVNESFFESLLSQLPIPKEKWSDVDRIELEIHWFRAWNENDYSIAEDIT